MSFSLKISLYFKVYSLRFVASIASFLDRYFSSPVPPKHSFTVSIPTTLRPQPSKIDLLFYTPKSYQPKSHKYALIVNFHGGGYTLGRATDDARWAAEVTNRLDAVLVSVEYGLAPEHPYPTAIGDGVDAIRWLWSRAEEYGLDSTRTITTGFSAGGTLSLATPLRLQAEMKINPQPADTAGTITAIVAFYPGVDWTQTRAERTASNAISGPNGTIPPWLYDMFDRSYLGFEHAKRNRRTPYLSPGRADTEVLRSGFPHRLALYSCEWDQLLVEDEALRERLKGLGKLVGGRMMRGVPHGFDKKPSLRGGNGKRDEMYQDAIKEMESMLEI
jgi:acetyl esterase/lipase